VKIKKLINLLKRSNTIDDPVKLSLGSLYFAGTSFGMHDGSEVIVMPVSIGIGTMSLYCITAYRYHILKNSNHSMVLSQLKTHKLLTIIARIVGVKINRKIADMLFDVFSEGTSSERNIITIKVDGRDISFLDHVITLNNDEIRKLKLYLIKRIVDVREWPGLAIRKWATYHLKVNDDSMRYI